MPIEKGNFLTDVIQSPWWLNAALGVAAFLMSFVVKGVKAGFIPVGLLFSQLLKFLAVVFLIGAIISWLLVFGKSVFGSSLRKMMTDKPEPERPNPAHVEWGHAAKNPFFSQTGSLNKATVIGESGAWIDIAEKMQRQGLNIRHLEDIHPLLIQLRNAYQPSVANFHAEIAQYIRMKNTQIAVLRAEPGFFITIINWFRVMFCKWDIRKLYSEEKLYSDGLSENIQKLEALLQSRELAGAKAELDVIAQLACLPAEYTIFNNIRLRAARYIKFNGVALYSAQLDHLVLSPAGVFVIETKHWSKEFSESGRYHNPFDQVERAGYLCYDLLNKAFGKVRVRSIILSAGSLPMAPTDSYVKVMHLLELTKYVAGFNHVELMPSQIHDLHQYFEQRVVAFVQPSLADNPEGIRRSDFLKGMMREFEQEQSKSPASVRPANRRAVLIPTEPPPSKIHDERRYMPPAMRKEFEEIERKKRGERVLENTAESGMP